LQYDQALPRRSLKKACGSDKDCTMSVCF